MKQLLDIWPTISSLADDLGLPYPTVQSWKHRGIPPRRFPQIIAAAEKRGHALTYEALLADNARGATAPDTPVPGEAAA